MNTNKNYTFAFITIMVAYFTMGFVDLAGAASNYIKNDFQLSDSVAGFLPTMVFFWFLILSVPVSLLMNRIGRQKTVFISLVIATLSLAIPLICYDFVSTLIAFALLGIGNTFLQVSLNPLLSNIVSGKKLASSITFGQFMKAICSFSAPILAGQAAIRLGNWKYIFAIYLAISVVSVIMMGIIKIKDADDEKNTSTFKDCFALLKDSMILLFFIGILCHVGIDAGINVTVPKILMERVGLGLHDAVYATSIYFVFRTAGCLSGTWILSKFSNDVFFTISVIMMMLGLGGLYFLNSAISMYVCIGLLGFGNSNIFPVIFSKALLHSPDKKNEVSGLLIMGVFGGAIFPLLMGIMADVISSQAGALVVITLCAFYLLFLSRKNFKLNE